ncbi:fimbrial protein [Candidatus Arsenophonus nilaparvatae]|uniref:fimbrial protein n=1 Tax=Candidatus Arsenophonus nilaparvatae TaxID=1247023 RepID=UPI0005094689|nr:fimbrial protein [Candidatus Arsenophonus nilaparvatae]
MKNTLTSYFIGISLILFSKIAFSATDGTVTFSGAIIDTPCDVTLSPGSSNSSLAIDMGVYMKDKVPSTSGQKVNGSERPLAFRLKNCPHYDGHSIVPKITFKANKDDHNPKLIKLDGSGAEGVGIGLYDDSGNLLDIRDIYQHNIATPKGGVLFIIPFKVAYVSNGETAKPGKANASISFEIAYK